MNLKTLVGVPLILSIILAGSIILFGAAGKDNFFIYYAIFAFFCTSIIIYSMRKIIDGKVEYAAAIVFGILIVFSAAFCADSLKSYYETSKQLSQYTENITQENLFITQKNNYYVEYINYTQEQILKYQNNSLFLQSKINQAIAESDKLREQKQQIVIVQIVPQDEYEEYYDD
jgi:hypothetical protein